MISQLCREFPSKLNLKSLLYHLQLSNIYSLPVQEQLPGSHAILYGELLKSLFLASFPIQIIIIWLSLPTKLSEGSRASEFIQVLILVRFPESYFGDQIRQRSEKINFSQKFTDIIKNTNIQQLVSKCPKNELQDMLQHSELDTTRISLTKHNCKNSSVLSEFKVQNYYLQSLTAYNNFYPIESVRRINFYFIEIINYKHTKTRV
ncbi:Hypothetical_protein [Hexamita inflata]|uniref:Hypothetical_protein n=1 Tax=Hexamita inflata TaxID=28002 RepID=A0AA86PQY1_9EUKA|nr:Hypothetical protein HINF_LOCUS27172 [Hexamita inflata]